MPQTLLISEIEDNPFQSRKRIDQTAVDRLAAEIKATGFWDAALRVRRSNGKYQLVVAHQRLRALRQLGQKRVNVELVALDDIAMAQQSLIENVQRDNLPEVDKAEAIARLLTMMTAATDPNSRSTSNRKDAVDQLCKLLGYKSPATIEEFLSMAAMSEPTKQVMRRENMARGAARVARSIGGEKMVRHAASKRISQRDLEPMQNSLRDLPEPARKKVVDKILENQIEDPEKIRRLARREAEKGLDLEKYNPDVMLFIAKWTGDLRVWTKKIKAATKVKNYVHQHPEILGEFRNAAEEFWAALRELLDL